MTQLQLLAIKRIKVLVESIDLQMSAYGTYRNRTEAEALEKDQLSADIWSAANQAKAEAVQWATALLAEKTTGGQAVHA